MRRSAFEAERARQSVSGDSNAIVGLKNASLIILTRHSVSGDSSAIAGLKNAPLIILTYALWNIARKRAINYTGLCPPEFSVTLMSNRIYAAISQYASLSQNMRERICRSTNGRKANMTEDHKHVTVCQSRQQRRCLTTYVRIFQT